MKILFTCGGTAGHINPALAVAGLVKKRHPNADILFVGAEGGMETDLVPREGFAIKTLKARRLKHKLTPAALVYNARVAASMAGLLREAGDILREFRPDVVVGMGGFASFPVVQKAASMGIPTAVHESNALPGVTTKLLSRKADCVMVSYPDSAKHYRHPERVILTGTPVKGAILDARREDARRELGLDARPLAVSFFGSLGARDMNGHMVEFLQMVAEKDGFQHLHAAGKAGFAWLPEKLLRAGVCLDKQPGVMVVEYIHNMPAVLAACDLVICRAGASTLAELCAVGKPAILIPSPNVTGDHQTKNARAMADRGGAILLPESECSGKLLYDKTRELLANPAQMRQMSEVLFGLAVLDAADRIYTILMELAQKTAKKQ